MYFLNKDNRKHMFSEPLCLLFGEYLTPPLCSSPCAHELTPRLPASPYLWYVIYELSLKGLKKKQGSRNSGWETLFSPVVEKDLDIFHQASFVVLEPQSTRETPDGTAVGLTRLTWKMLLKYYFYRWLCKNWLTKHVRITHPPHQQSFSPWNFSSSNIAYVQCR